MNKSENKNKFIRLPELRHRLGGLSRSSIYLRVSRGEMPAPISLGGRAKAWIEPEIDEYIEGLISASRKNGGATNVKP